MNITDLSVFPVGESNDAYAKYFIGQSYLNMLSTEQVAIGNVTFEPRCRNNWHIHHAEKGDVVNIPANVKHWHGAAKDSFFQHLAIEVPAENGRTEWCEPVTDEEYDKL